MTFWAGDIGQTDLDRATGLYDAARACLETANAELSAARAARREILGSFRRGGRPSGVNRCHGNPS